jgi:quinoprotein glucose dehydrogenase
MPAVAKLVPRTGMEAEVAPPSDMDVSKIIRFPQLDTPYSVENWFLTSPLGAPCSKPPWGRLTAVDMVNATIKWQVALGSLEKLLPLPVPLEMGTPSSGGAIVTAGGVIFIAATVDDKFRAFDTETGEVLWKTKLPAGGQATPMTYAVEGRQYVVIAAGGHALYRTTPGDYVIAYSLK